MPNFNVLVLERIVHVILCIPPMAYNLFFAYSPKTYIILRRKFRLKIHEIDELIFPTFIPLNKLTVFIHPIFYIMSRVISAKKMNEVT